MHRLTLALTVALGLVITPRSAGAQNVAVEAQELIPDNLGFGGSLFGDAVAIEGNVAVIAGPARRAENGDHDGRIHVYERESATSEWVFVRTLWPDVATPSHSFGAALAMDGDLLVVGSPSHVAGVGGFAYVFRRAPDGTWSELQRVSEPSTSSAGGAFGRDVDIHQSTFVVGDSTSQGNGRVYVYAPSGTNTWSRQATLAPPSGSTGNFGVSVSLYGNQLAVGFVRRAQSVGGEVRTYTRSGTVWSLEAVLQPDSVPYGQYANDDFGWSVDLVANLMVVGAPSDQNPNSPSTTLDRGAAFIFRRTSGVWSQYSRIDPITSAVGAGFGEEVRLETEIFQGVWFTAIGATGASSAATPAVSNGAVYIHELSGGLWLQRHRLLGQSATQGSYLGRGLALAVHLGAWSVLGGAPNEGIDDHGVVHAFGFTSAAASQTQLVEEPAHTGTRFGSTIGVDGAVTIVGAPEEDIRDADDVGAAYLYDREGSEWGFRRRLASPLPESGDRFGASVSVSGNTAVVGAPGDNRSPLVDCGTVYVYERGIGAWSLAATLTPQDSATGDGFGTSVSIRGDLIVVGAPGDNNAGGTDAGAAYVFARSNGTWSQASKLATNDLAAQDLLGSSVAVASATRVLVGAPFADATVPNTGAAYVFDRIPIIGGVSWIQRAKLTPPGLALGDRLGVSVAVSGNFVAVGAPRDTVNAQPAAGAVHVYEITGGIPGTTGNTFTFRQTLFDPQPDQEAMFGDAVALEGSQLVVGVPQADQFGATWAGKSVLFRRQTGGVWNVVETQAASDFDTLDRFGDAVALSGNWLMVGASEATHMAGDFGGAVYAFDLWTAGPVGEAYCGSAPNATGQAAGIEGSGSPFVAANSLVLRATDLPQNSTAFFLVSRDEGFSTQPGGSAGNLCLGGGIGRFVGPGQVLNSGTAGQVQLTVDLNALPSPAGATAAAPGDTWRFQAWYRDSGPSGPTSNFTPGLGVVVH